jgi:hypothetical protein
MRHATKMAGQGPGATVPRGQLSPAEEAGGGAGRPLCSMDRPQFVKSLEDHLYGQAGVTSVGIAGDLSLLPKSRAFNLIFCKNFVLR